MNHVEDRKRKCEDRVPAGLGRNWDTRRISLRPSRPSMAIFPNNARLWWWWVGGGPEFDHDICGELAGAADKVIIALGDLLPTARWYIDRWRARKIPTTSTPQRSKVPELFAPSELYSYSTRESTSGVAPSWDRQPVRFRRNPYAPIVGQSETTASCIPPHGGSLLKGA